MRATVRAAGITKRRTRTGVAAGRFGALTLGLGLAMLAGGFFAGPALAEQGTRVPSGFVLGHEDGHDDEEPPACGEDPLPPCQTETPPPPDPPAPTDTGEPPVEPPPTNEPTAKPSNVKTKPPADDGKGGSDNTGGNQGNNGGSGGSSENDGPQLPATGIEAGLLAGMGAALVGGGVALVVLARRRRAALATPSESGDDQS
jgi:LPXTG-motif cell wall-anchored protein